ncbi:MAG: M1 family aminopeptidase [Chloroflexota bacterium]
MNNHPADAALWTLSLTVPEGAAALAGGAPSEPVAAGEGVTTTWVYDDPVSPYLLAFAAGAFEIVREAGPGGLPVTLALPPDLPPEPRATLGEIPAMLEYFEGLFGPYPGRRFGAAVVDGFGGALETEEMVIFGRPSVSPRTVAHEIAHHWFGNSVRIESWSDIWLNEAFGRYAEILWTEHAEGPIARDAALGQLAGAVTRQAAAGAPPVALPTIESLFGGNTYNRGALMLHALRARLGDDAFFALLRDWNARYANEAAGTDEFVALATSFAGEDLSEFFDDWLYRPEAPDPLLPPLG